MLSQKCVLPIAMALVIVSTTLSTSSISAQKVVIPEEIKRKCADIALEQRVRLAVARFSQTTSGKDRGDVANFSSMLSNAMFEVDCFRMLSMVKDSLDNKDAYETSTIKPQLVITGEITEYNHTVKETRVMMSKKIEIVSHIGFILQIKDPVTRDVLFSKSFNEQGSSENKSLTIRLPRVPIPGQGSGEVVTSSNDAVDKAYFDALEKGILQAVTYIIDSRDKIYAFSKATGNKTTLLISKANYAKLIEIEKVMKDMSIVTKVEKALDKSEGRITVYHNGEANDLLGILSKNNTLEITGLDRDKIILTVK